MATYPADIKSWTDLMDGTDNAVADDINSAYAEITAIQTELGTNPRAGFIDVDARLDDMTTDISNCLTVGKKRRIQIETVKGDESNPPEQGQIDGTGVSKSVLWFDADTDEKIHFCINIPNDCDVDQNVSWILDCCVGTTGSPDNYDVRLALNVISVSNGQNLNGGEVIMSPTIETDTWAANYMYRKEITIYGQQIGLVNNATLYCTLRRGGYYAGYDTFDHDFGILHMAFEYECKDPAS